MAAVEIEVAGTPEQAWAVLADPYAYRAWVLGTKEIRGADEGFPAAGTRLYHRIGAGPLTLADSTTVVRAEPPRLLILDARLGPLGSARVEIELEAEGPRTRVRLREIPGRGATRLLYPAADALLRGRNRWSLERFRDLVERRA